MTETKKDFTAKVECRLFGEYHSSCNEIISLDRCHERQKLSWAKSFCRICKDGLNTKGADDADTA